MKRDLFFIGTTALLTLVLIGAGSGLALRDDGIQFPDGSVQMSAAVAGLAPVEDTGQTECFDASGSSRNCAATGEDGEFQAGVAWPTPRFLDNGDGTVTDNLTGLMWLKDGNCAGAVTNWQAALDWVKDLNAMSIACTDYAAMTFTDWRLPNVKELLSLVDYSKSGPAMPSSHPFVTVQSSFYWSSSSFADGSSAAWDVTMQFGIPAENHKSNTGDFVWPVRGGH